MKQNLFLTGVFFIVLFGMKYLFDKSDMTSMLIYSVIGAAVFFVYRTFIRTWFINRNKKDQD
ncbi:hypothetical protein [Faecalibacter bovis]|uniref:Uncharacterized protein n=1 Tax=Faecalibacter bovis TaxID=2898187 RepID=A0ABX7XE33_9FLAO|nr:hypothetical protein [Faecalibacter bovis]MBS7333210.1 hypothetical protein [Weeksellaceae bacterium]QTV06140.1 hypothetical protein J9309_02010 [Faecalibacter bovis]